MVPDLNLISTHHLDHLNSNNSKNLPERQKVFGEPYCDSDVAFSDEFYERTASFSASFAFVSPPLFRAVHLPPKDSSCLHI